MIGRFSISITAFAFLALTACQSSMIRAFQNVQNGMDKHQVLEMVGDPNSTTRMHGKDRWLYHFYEDGVPRDKEVHFQGGQVVYVGDPWQPAPERTATATDAKHAEQEAAIQAQEQKNIEDRKNANDALAELEKQSRHQDKVRYMPTFVDVK